MSSTLSGTKSKRDRQMRNLTHWSIAEDDVLLRHVNTHGQRKWGLAATKLRNKNEKQCRERYKYKLNPSIKTGDWTPEEDAFILHRRKCGEKWSNIEFALTELNNGIMHRTDHQIKMRFRSIEKALKKGVMPKSNPTNSTTLHYRTGSKKRQEVSSPIHNANSKKTRTSAEIINETFESNPIVFLKPSNKETNQQASSMIGHSVFEKFDGNNGKTKNMSTSDHEHDVLNEIYVIAFDECLGEPDKTSTSSIDTHVVNKLLKKVDLNVQDKFKSYQQNPIQSRLSARIKPKTETIGTFTCATFEAQEQEQINQDGNEITNSITKGVFLNSEGTVGTFAYDAFVDEAADDSIESTNSANSTDTTVEVLNGKSSQVNQSTMAGESFNVKEHSDNHHNSLGNRKTKCLPAQLSGLLSSNVVIDKAVALEAVSEKAVEKQNDVQVTSTNSGYLKRVEKFKALMRLMNASGAGQQTAAINGGEAAHNSNESKSSDWNSPSQSQSQSERVHMTTPVPGSSLPAVAYTPIPVKLHTLDKREATNTLGTFSCAEFELEHENGHDEEEEEEVDDNNRSNNKAITACDSSCYNRNHEQETSNSSYNYNNDHYDWSTVQCVPGHPSVMYSPVEMREVFVNMEDARHKTE